METIRLKGRSEYAYKRQLKAVILNSLPGLEEYESYLLLSDGKICSGKGGNFKMLQSINDFYILSYQRPFMKSVQTHFSKKELITKYKENRSIAVMADVIVY